MLYLSASFSAVGLGLQALHLLQDWSEVDVTTKSYFYVFFLGSYINDLILISPDRSGSPTVFFLKKTDCPLY